MTMAKLDGRTIEGRFANYLAERIGTNGVPLRILKSLGAGIGLNPEQSERALARLIKKGVVGEDWRRKGWYFLS